MTDLDGLTWELPGPVPPDYTFVVTQRLEWTAGDWRQMSLRTASRGLGKWDSARLAWRLYRDPRVSPRLKKLVTMFGLVYVLLPIDLLPDLFLGLGQLDDLGVVSLVAAASFLLPRFAAADVLAEHLRAMGVLRDETKLRAEQAGKASRRATDIIDAHFQVRG